MHVSSKQLHPSCPSQQCCDLLEFDTSAAFSSVSYANGVSLDGSEDVKHRGPETHQRSDQS